MIVMKLDCFEVNDDFYGVLSSTAWVIKNAKHVAILLLEILLSMGEKKFLF